MHWYCKRKLDSDHYWEFKGVTIKPKEEICAVIYNKTNNLDIKLVFLSFNICNMFSVKEGPVPVELHSRLHTSVPVQAVMLAMSAKPADTSRHAFMNT